MSKSGKGNIPQTAYEEGSYPQEVSGMVAALHFPNEESAYSINSPNYFNEKDAPSSRTPAPKTPNEQSANQSNNTRSKENTVEKEEEKTKSQERKANLTNIDESNISNENKEEEGDLSAEKSNNMDQPSQRIDPQKMKESQNAESEGKARFPKMQAATLEINERTMEDDSSPMPSRSNKMKKGYEGEESLSISPSHTSNDKEEKNVWAFTPLEAGPNLKIEDNTEEKTNSPAFMSNQDQNDEQEQDQAQAQASNIKGIGREGREEAKLNLDVEIEKRMNNEEYVLSEDFYKIRVELSETIVRIRQFEEECEYLRNDAEAKAEKLQKTEECIADFQQIIEEKEEHINLLQQKCMDNSKLPDLRGEMLESAKNEINQMKHYIQERDQKIGELESLLSQKENTENNQNKIFMSELENLCAEREQQQIVIASIKKKNQQLEAELSKNKKVGGLEKIKELEEIIKDYEQKLSEERGKNDEILSEFEKAKEELEQLANVRADYNKQAEEMQVINEEVLKQKEQLTEIETKKCPNCSSLQEEIEQMKSYLKLKEDEEWQVKITEIMRMAEIGQIMKFDLEKKEKEIGDLQQELMTKQEIPKIDIKETEEYKGLLQEIEKLKELNTQNEDINKIVKEKEEENEMIQQSCDNAKKTAESQKKEIENLNNQQESLKQQLIKLIDGITGRLSFTFIELEFPVNPSMSIPEKIKNIDKLLDYIQIIKENINAHNAANVSNIASLKDLLQNKEKENNMLIESQRNAINMLETEKSGLLRKIADLESDLEKHDAIKKTQNTEEGEIQKLREQVAKERAHTNEALLQLQDIHKKELEDINTGKQANIKQLGAKIKELEDKLKRKKEKSIQKLQETEELLKKHEANLLEKANIQSEYDKLRDQLESLEKLHKEKELKIQNECENIKLKLENAEKSYKESPAKLQNLNETLKSKLENYEKMHIEQVNALTKSCSKISQDLAEKDRLYRKLQDENSDLLLNKARDIKKLEVKSVQTEEKGENTKDLKKKIESQEMQIKQIQNQFSEEVQKPLKSEIKKLNDEKDLLAAECNRLKQLLDEAKTDMKKMMDTTKRMRNVRNSFCDEQASKNNLESQLKIQKAKNALELERIMMAYEDDYANLLENFDKFKEKLIQDTLATFDELISTDLKKYAKGDYLKEQLFERIKNLREQTESKYIKEIEEMRLCLMKKASINLSGSINCRTFHESLTLLKESLKESEKMIEQSAEKKILEERKKIRDEICRTSSVEAKRYSSEIKPRESKQINPKDSCPMLVQQYKKEIDKLNNDDIYCESMKAVSFGLPEAPEQDEETLNNLQNPEEVVEECRRHITEELEQEWKQKMQNLENEIEMLKAQHKEQIAKLQSGSKVEQEILKQENKESEKRMKQIELELKIKFDQQIQMLNEEKAKEMEELLRIKENETKSKANTELTRELNNKKEELTKQYMKNKELLQKDFDLIKEKMNNELEERTLRIERDYQESIKESERIKQETERKYNERAEEKEKLMENILKMRLKEIEDDYKMKTEKFEYNIKYETQCQTERQRADLANEQKQLEAIYKQRIEELENKVRGLAAENRDKVILLETEINKVKDDSEKNTDQFKKKIEKECALKVESMQKKVKEAEEKINKLSKEIEEINKQAIEEKENAIELIQKKLKEEQKQIKEKHKAEIRTVKENQKNELIKKNIEKEREIKKITEKYESQIEELNKQASSKTLLKVDIKQQEDKKEAEKILQQKLNILKKKFEKEYQEKEKAFQEEIKKKHNEETSLLERNLQMQFEEKLKDEINKLKLKYKEKKKKLAEKRAEYEEHLKSAMKETRIRDSMASKPEGKYSEISLSEIDAEGIVKENEEKLKLAEKNEHEKLKLKEEYEGKIKKLERELEAISSRNENRIFEALQTFVDILTLELDKLLKHFNTKNKENAGTNEDINTTIAKLIVTISPDGKCGILLQNFKIKLNNVLGAFKKAIEEKYKKQKVKTTEQEEVVPIVKPLKPESKKAEELKKYIEVMDKDYEKNILSKISPIRNNNGKYVVDIEKVVRDLLLVKEALYSVFHKGGNPDEKDDTNLAILDELTKIQTLSETSESAIEGIAKQYRILLNTILRYAVEAAWVVGQQNNGEKAISTIAVKQEEEMLRLKLIISELKEQLSNSGKEKEELDKKLALFVGENSGYVS